METFEWKKFTLPKPVDLLNLKVFHEFNATLNGKLKSLAAQGFGERNGASALILKEVETILLHPTVQKNTPKELLW